jgi:hypothetical protein
MVNEIFEILSRYYFVIGLMINFDGWILSANARMTFHQNICSNSLKRSSHVGLESSS